MERKLEPHYIIMSSSYTKGTRIAIDLTGKNLEEEFIRKILERIKKQCGSDVSLSSHAIIAQGKNWGSVIKADRFFKTVMLIDDVDTFIKEIKRDRVLKKVDVARYIAAKTSIQSQKLVERLVYDCYTEYFKKTKNRLFDDEKSEMKLNYNRNEAHLIEALRSRILFAEDGLHKLTCINVALERYLRI